MFSAFFGHYLLNEKIITPDQLEKALAHMTDVHLKLGTLAINAKVMTVPQVEDIHRQQLTCDQRFGTLAIEAGYMTEETLDLLLAVQKSEHLRLAQALVDLDLLTFDAYETHLENYKTAHQLSDEALDGLKAEDVATIVDTFCVMDDEHHARLYRDYVTLFLKNQMRFINAYIRLGAITPIQKNSYDHLIRQSLHSGQDYFTAIAGDEKSMTTFAGLYANERFKTFGEYPIDAIGEYMNQSNGLFVVNHTNEGNTITMDIQSHIEGPTLKPYRKVYDIPLHCSCGEIHLILGQL